MASWEKVEILLEWDECITRTGTSILDPSSFFCALLIATIHLK
jgi:hypothetical protein